MRRNLCVIAVGCFPDLIKRTSGQDKHRRQKDEPEDELDDEAKDELEDEPDDWATKSGRKDELEDAMKQIHGGDIYDKQIHLDFSVNINPLGIPERVEEAIYKSVRQCVHYPQINAQTLCEETGRMLGISSENLIFGNGASELFMAVIHALKPQKILIPVPSFYGYEHAAMAAEGEVVFYETKKEGKFLLTERFFKALDADVDLLFLANPNNPTGALLDRDFLRKILDICREKEIVVVVDECFIDFCEDGYSLLGETENYRNLIVVQAFTKIFSIPGVRLGYLVCSNGNILLAIQRHLPEWNTSVVAQAAGMACIKETDFIKETRAYVKKERQFLEMELGKSGFTVYSGQADFILVYDQSLHQGKPLYEYMLQRGILIRDCQNFRGLSKGYYRIAVKRHEENIILLRAIQDDTNSQKVQSKMIRNDNRENESIK